MGIGIFFLRLMLVVGMVIFMVFNGLNWIEPSRKDPNRKGEYIGSIFLEIFLVFVALFILLGPELIKYLVKKRKI